MRVRPSPRMLVVAIVALVILGGCGGDGAAGGTKSGPTPGKIIAMGRFDDIPLVPGSRPFGVPSDDQGIVTQSFRVKAKVPAGILAFYADALPPAGWVSAEPAFRANAANRADWVRESYRLELSAVSVNDRNADASQAAVQYSLVLRPE